MTRKSGRLPYSISMLANPIIDLTLSLEVVVKMTKVSRVHVRVNCGDTLLIHRG